MAAPESPSCPVDGLGPLPLHEPESAALAGETIRRAAVEGRAIYPVGGGTMLDWGLPPKRAGWALGSTHLDRIVDYQPADMTVTLGAGVRAGCLQKLLREKNQWLPIDIPCCEKATIGGALAANVSGPRRYGFGTLRDYVIGIKAVNDLGQEIKAGGRVVKNVAGYDLCKLLVGSFGTLGLITEVTLKVHPIPEEQALVLVRCRAQRLAGLLNLVHGSRTRPVCLDVLNPAAVRSLDLSAGANANDDAWLAFIGFAGNSDAVAWQVEELLKELPAEELPGLEVRAGATAEPFWRALCEFPLLAERPFTFQVTVLPSICAETCLRVSALAEDVAVQAHAGNGTVLGHLRAGVTEETARAVLAEIRQSILGTGNVVVRRCPSAWKVGLSVWGQARSDSWLSRRVKEVLDPRHIFNPGRFLDFV